MNQLLLDNPFVLSLLIFTAVILIKVFLSIFFIKEPMHLFRFFCAQLAKKVNNKNNSSSQQKVAGLLAAFITIAPLIIIFWLFEDFVEIDWLWHGFLLYFALGSFGLTRSSIKTAKALSANNTAEAKQLINPLTLRNTDSLSSLGITKACIEMHLLQTIQQCFAVAFFYFIFGPYAALSFRLLLEIHYSWNIKAVQYKAFGSLTNKLVQLLLWLPSRVFLLFIMLGTVGQNYLLIWKLSAKYFFNLNNTINLYVVALIIGKKLGGVALYNNIKVRRISLNDRTQEPEPKDIIYSVKRINQVLYFSYLCLVFSAVLTLILSITA